MALKSLINSVYFVDSPESLREVFSFLKKEKQEYIIIGGGSNSLFQEEISRVGVVIELGGISYTDDFVTVGAGVVWDEFVQDTITRGYSGFEALSGIPGNVGATPIQNVGAYGCEVSSLIESVYVYDIEADTFTTLSREECAFGYRTSNFKTLWLDRYCVVSVTFLLSKEQPLIPLYPGVKEAMQSTTPTAQEIRDAILAIRWSKLPKPEILPNVGSFFHNPIVTDVIANKLQDTFPDIKVFDASVGMKKISAGWLIEHAGWKGKSLGPVGMYEKNALVMVNHGGATLTNVVSLEEAIKKDVHDMFGVTLVREPSIIT